MAKAKTANKEPKKRTRRSFEGTRWSLFFSKGDAKNRVRVFPGEDCYKVSVVKSVKGVTTDRSVQEFETLEDATHHAYEITDTATRAGWSVKAGVKANNLGLFE